jgi:dTDP-4-dehydrorhamnose reductase
MVAAAAGRRRRLNSPGPGRQNIDNSQTTATALMNDNENLTPLRWVVTGAAGMLGRDLLDVLREQNHADVVPLARGDLDIADDGAVEKVLEPFLHPGAVVVNCAAWTAVDDAETHEPAAFRVNALGPAVLARACARTGAGLVQISTDYVFDGAASAPYPVDAAPGPRSAYGRTKLAGEWAVRAELPGRHRILRTAWLYGTHGGNFVATMSRLEREREHVDVVDDQIGQPTWTRDLAGQIVRAAAAGLPAGTYHAVASGQTSWHGLAREVFALRGADPARVRSTTSAAFVRPAPRPAWSVLDVSGWEQAGTAPMRPWDEALRAAFAAGSFNL